MREITNKNVQLEELRSISGRLSRQVIEITTRAGSGHPSSSLSAIDVLVVLYFGGVLRYRADNPGWAERDRFILSKGHGAPGLYVTLAEAGFFNPDMLPTLRMIGSPLEGHPNMRVVPGLEASTGSLGQGLSIGLGHALAARVDGRESRVYVMLGDGEAEEGQVWEASMAAAKYKVDNLTALLDHNLFQQTGAVEEVMPSITPMADKWRAFGWHVREIDGHDHVEILQAFSDVREVIGQPQMVICHTKKGRGLSVFEADAVNRKHGEPLSLEEAKQAIAELESRFGSGEGA